MRGAGVQAGPAVGLTSPSLCSFQEVTEESNRSSLGYRKRGRSQTTEALNPCSAGLRSACRNREPRKEWKQEWTRPSSCCEGKGSEGSPEARSPVGAGRLVVQGETQGGGMGSSQGSL